MKKNPYDVLGVSDNASDEQIKEAYRALARKYSSDNYSGGNLEGVAASKMKEIDEAYDTIIMLRSERSSGRGRSYSSSASYSNTRYAGTGEYDDIREKIRKGSLDDAEMLLDGVEESGRSAEWYFLKGSIQNRRGWLDEASANYARACKMDPDNAEYRAAYNNLGKGASGGYRNVARDRHSGGCSACDVCSSLLCADCCCECMGGDLIRCC
ncbi:MAG: DnaJ domain-containing protein [Clostridia bacterium]|nr:DnaJ domain-containing protein [Clostridia bacterium]